MIDDLRHFRSDHPSMVRLAVTLWITVAVMLPITVISVANLNAAPQASSSSYPSAGPPATEAPAEAAPITESDLLAFSLRCMNVGAQQLNWTEPHTGRKMSLFCENYAFPFAQ